MRQAQKIPAYLHPDNNQPPIPAEGKAFIPNGMAFVDPADNAAYYSNGHGYFEGLNMKCVREHPKHTLLPVLEENCELGYGHLDRLLKEAKTAASEFGQKAEDEIDMLWICDKLSKHGIQYERQRVPGSTDKHPHYVMAKILGFTKAHEEAIRQELNEWLAQKRRRKEEEKEKRKEDREFTKTLKEKEMQESVEKAKEQELRSRYKELYVQAADAGISTERFNALFKLTAEAGQEAILTDDSIALFAKYVANEIDVIAQKSDVKEKAATAQLELFGTEPKNDFKPEKADKAIESLCADMAEQKSITVSHGHGTTILKEGETLTVEPDKVTVSKARETYTDDDGCVRYKDTDEYAEVAPELLSSLLSDAPEATTESGEKKKFTIDNEGAARWLVRKIRSNQKRIEQAERDLKEAKDALAAIKTRAQNDNAGLKFVLGQQLLGFVKSLLTNSKGELKKQSHVFMEGTVKLKDTGGLVCKDKAAFKLWWEEMRKEENDAERAMFAHTVSYSMSETQIEQNLRDGLEIPGYQLDDIVKFSDFEITAPPKPRKKKGDDQADSEDSAEDAA